MFRQLVPRERLFEPLDLLETDFESLADRFFGTEVRRFRGMRSIVPKIDLGETDAQFEVKAELPGVKPEDVMATLEKLGDLKAKGILTQDEFDAKKAELLKKLV